MKKIDMVNEINQIMGYEFLRAWESFSYAEVHHLWAKLKSGKYNLVQRGYEYVFEPKKQETRNRVLNDTVKFHLMAAAVFNEDEDAIMALGYTAGTARQYVQFSKLLKSRGHEAMRSYSALSQNIMEAVCKLYDREGEDITIKDYKNKVERLLEDLDIDGVFSILDATQDLISELELERE